MSQPTMFLAEMDSRRERFLAIAPTRRQALDALRKGVRKRSRHLLEKLGKGDDQGDINVLEMEPLAAYADDLKI